MSEYLCGQNAGWAKSLLHSPRWKLNPEHWPKLVKRWPCTDCNGHEGQPRSWVFLPKHAHMFFFLLQNFLPLSPGKFAHATLWFVKESLSQSNRSPDGKKKNDGWGGGAGKYTGAQRRYSTLGSSFVSWAAAQPFPADIYFAPCDIK